MSHFTVLCIGKDVEEQLKPYSEHLIVDEYSKGSVTEKEKQQFMEYYQKDEKYKTLSFDDIYKFKGNDWNSNCWRKYNDEWEEFSTYNPKSKWDWYSVGGRWSCEVLETKDGFVDECYKSECINLNTIETFAILKNGEWFEKGSMGWWAIVSNENENWKESMKEILSDVSDEELLTLIDCHI